MPDARAKAEGMVPTGAGFDSARETIVEALADDLRTAARDATVADDKLATLQTQALGLSDALEAIAETAARYVGDSSHQRRP